MLRSRKKEGSPTCIHLGVEYFDLETGLIFFASNIQLVLTNPDAQCLSKFATMSM